MKQQNIEVEIKALLGTFEEAEALKGKIRELDPQCRLVGTHKQLNHYFIGGEKALLEKNFQEHIAIDDRERFSKVIHEGRNISLRTRKADEVVLLVVKASIDDTTSENGTARIEFEAKMPMSIDELDALILASGCEYQAKWSREREEYVMSNGTHVCIDRNAGYGYLAEFERVVSEDTSADEVKKELRALMEKLGVSELPQDRLERMFAYYNQHWQEYYGTEKVFLVE